MIAKTIIYYLFFNALLYICYKLIYANNTFTKINRGLLLLTTPLAFSIALIAPHYTIPNGLNSYSSFRLPEITIEGKALSETVEVVSQSHYYWSNLYYIGLIISGLYFLLGLIYLRKIYRSSEQQVLFGYSVFLSQKIESAFSFGPFIFIPYRFLDDNSLETIVLHEIYHKKLKHNWDQIYYRILSILFWFDPFTHASAKELKQVHEFEVDALIIQNKNIEDYAHLLLSCKLGGDLTYPEKALGPSPFFNSSSLKTRITMMYQNESPNWKKSLYFGLIPILAAMTLFACNKSTENNANNSENNSQAETVSMAEIDRFPIAIGCDVSASADEAQNCSLEKIMAHIGNNFKYPQLAEELGIEGRIFIEFIVSKEGKVEGAQILRSITYENTQEEEAVLQAEEEALNLVSSIPSFLAPGQKEGKAVALKMVLPINLKLS